jgi:hypothetical protein
MKKHNPNKGNSHFRRYTNLASTIHLLRNRQITLLNPATWDDKNDAYYMAEYKRYKKAQTVLALCFAKQSERYHHWRVFSHGSDGVCIEFDQQGLLATFDGDPRVRHRGIEYKLLKHLRSITVVRADELPFMKREPFRDECEYRVVYTDPKEALSFKSYDIELSCINKITLSPWMSEGLADAVISTLRSIEGCSQLRIGRTTLIENETWKALTAKVQH